MAGEAGHIAANIHRSLVAEKPPATVARSRRAVAELRRTEEKLPVFLVVDQHVANQANIPQADVFGRSPDRTVGQRAALAVGGHNHRFSILHDGAGGCFCGVDIPAFGEELAVLAVGRFKLCLSFGKA